MKKRLLLLALEFVAVTASLGWLWIKWGRDAYIGAVVSLATPFFMLIGVRQLEAQLVADHFINYVPFLVLMIITPNLTLRRRLIGGLIGTVVIFLGHVALASVAYVAKSKYGLTDAAFTTLLPAYLLNDSLPFILWAAIAWNQIKQFTSRFPVSRLSG